MSSSYNLFNSNPAVLATAQMMICRGMLYKIDISLPLEKQLESLDPGRYSFILMKDSSFLYLHGTSHTEAVKFFNLNPNLIEAAGEIIFSPRGKIIYLNFKTGGYYNQLHLDNPEIYESLKKEILAKFNTNPTSSEVFFSIKEVEFLESKLLNHYINEDGRFILNGHKANHVSFFDLDASFDEREAFADKANAFLFQLRFSQLIIQEKKAITQGPVSSRYEYSQPAMQQSHISAAAAFTRP